MGTLQREVGEQFVGYVGERLVARLAGLTDDEYLWEPVADCWSIRPGADGRWHADLGPGGTPHTEADPAPITTIAWRLWHIGGAPDAPWPPTGVSSGREFVEAWFGQPRPSSVPAAPTAAEACALVEQRWRAAATLFSSFTDEEYEEVMGEVAGPFAESTLFGLVLHVADELVHHGAEISLLRDLYAHRS